MAGVGGGEVGRLFRPAGLSGVFFVVEVRLKDGGTRVFADGATAGEMAAEVSVSLGKRALVCRVDGVLADLSTTPPEGG